MEVVREYLLGVTCAAILSGILCALADEKHTGGALVKLLCGIFLCLTLVRPLSGLRLEELTIENRQFSREGEAAAQTGMEYARQAEMQLIKSRTEAYILDKAAQYDLRLEVEVTVSHGEIPVPESVILRGQVSPYAKSRLMDLLETDIGIPKEKQQWMA